MVKSLPANTGDTRSIPDPGGFPYATEQLNPWPQPLSLCCRTWELHPLKPTCSRACAFYGESQGALVVKNSRTNAGDIKDAGSISGSVRSPRGGNGNPLQYSCLENPMDRGVWWVQSMGSQRVGHDWRGLLCTVDSQLPKGTWGHSCASRLPVGEVKSLWLVSIHCEARGKHWSWVSSPGWSGVGFRDQLAFFFS